MIMNTMFSILAAIVDTNSLPGHGVGGAGVADNNELQIILRIVFAVVGALALLVITISGFRYVLSNGDSQRTMKAKEGIIYALVGLIIAISAEGIVAFVLGGIK